MKTRVLRRLDGWLVRLGGGRLSSRIVVLSLLLLLVVQVAGFGVVRSSIERSARARLTGELAVGERIWTRLLETNAQRLRQGAVLLSADYGFRSAVTSGDTETISSALENHGARIGATVGALLDTGLQPRALHAASADAAGLAQLLHDIALPLARAGGDNGGSGIAIIDGQPHQFVVVPLRAPVTIGWVVMGFPLGQALASDMHALSGLQVALLSEATGRAPRLVTSTLDPVASMALLRQGPSPDAAVDLEGEAFFARTLVQGARGGALRTVLMRSVDDVVAPIRAPWFSSAEAIVSVSPEVTAARKP